jgi:hypothetical protein
MIPPKLAILIPVFMLPVSALADWKTDVGYVDLQTALGAGIPTGAGVSVSQIEANEGTSPTFKYLADFTHAENTGKTLSDASGIATANSSHAFGVGQVFYGNTSSIAPGVTSVTGFEANDWINNKLKYASGTDPVVETNRVANHSWVGTTNNVPVDTQILQRLDYQIDRDDYLGVVGLNNGVGVPQTLLSNSYNALSVGLTSGNHSYADTTVNGTGRAKPDIVAPGLHPTRGSTATSWATGMVSSAGAMLTEAAGATDAARPETLRAVLMAGATKTEFGSWSHTTTQPLDTVFGAGELNVFNSYNIIDGGEHEGTNNAAPGSAAPPMGWDYQSGVASPGTTTRYYTFDVPIGELADELSIILAWNAEVTDSDGGSAFVPVTTLANMDLKFYDSSSSFLGTLLAQSISTEDNIEHIYMTGLSAGTYTLAHTSDTDWDFGLAWRMETSPIPEPAAFSLLAATTAILLRRRRK